MAYISTTCTNCGGRGFFPRTWSSNGTSDEPPQWIQEQPTEKCHACNGTGFVNVYMVPMLPIREADEALVGELRPRAGETRKMPTKEEQAAQDARDRLLCEAGVACWVQAAYAAKTHLDFASSALANAENLHRWGASKDAADWLPDIVRHMTEAARALGCDEEE